MRLTLAAGLILALAGPAGAAGLLSEQRATEKAAAILKGDPYGTTFVEITRHIEQAQLVVRGTTGYANRPVNRPVWTFHVKAKSRDSDIDGWLDLDARSGSMLCATLPFLD